MPESRKSPVLSTIIIILVLILAVAAGWYMLSPKSDPMTFLEESLKGCSEIIESSTKEADPLLAKPYIKNFSAKVSSDMSWNFRSASADVTVRYLDLKALTANLGPDMQEQLASYVEQARKYSDIYDENDAFLSDVVDKAYYGAIQTRLEKADEYCKEETVTANLKYFNGSWSLTNIGELLSYSYELKENMPGLYQAKDSLQHVDFTYRLDDWTSNGPKPDESCYGETSNPSKITSLLNTKTAQNLINGQQLSWREDADFIPGSTMRYYMDETILVLVWQEDEHGAIATFSEVFIKDGSQLRRKLAGDTFGESKYAYATKLAQESNAVLAVSGDFYDLPARVYGLYVYDGQLMRSCLTAGQSCMFTSAGDMLFTYENQFASEEDVQKFVDENDVMFSLSFGPVILDKGEDVLPFDYPLGEIRDTYARCAIGQLGDKHYLAMTINVRVPDYNVYVTLRQAADSMISHGCYNAYTLDGGQTGSIILGGELINPVQFGYEREMTDIFYFASAIPEE